MRKLQICVIASNDQDQLDELQDILEDAEYEQQIRGYVSESGVSFINIAGRGLPSITFDVVIIEDQWVIASRILRHISQCEGINNVLVVNSSTAMEYILKMNLPDPAVITLDFLLEGNPTDPDEKLLDAFNATSELYHKVKQIWPLSCVMGISAWVVDSEGNPYPKTAPLIDLIRSNGDNAYPKGDELWPFIIHLVRNALSIYRIRAEKARAEEEAEWQRKRANETEQLARIERAARVVSGAPSIDKCPQDPPDPYLKGHSPEMRYVYWAIDKYAQSSIPVHIYGENGTGKMLVARAIHQLSSRRDRPFRPIDCPSFQNEYLLHSELFGHVKGSFTDAKTARDGLIQVANGGTVLFDDIDDLILPGQASLLRLIQERKARRLGSNEEYDVDIRLISTSKVDLQQAVKEGLFREDLLYRLSADRPIRLPALRERPEDIPELFDYFLTRECSGQLKPQPKVNKEAYEVFQRYDWPGNVRQLETTVQRIVALADLSLPISADVATSFLPSDYTYAIKPPFNAGVDQLAELILSNSKVVRRLNDYEAAYRKAEAARKGKKSKVPSLAEIGGYCSPPVSHSAISQFFKNHAELIGKFSRLSSDWPKLRNLDQWPQ